MKILELFSGQGSISKSFKQKGWEVFRVDWSEKVEAELHADISKLTVKDIVNLCGGIPDVIWASPDCTTYSIATHRHRTLKEGLKPKTEYAAQCDDTNIKMWRLIDDLLEAGSKYYFVENPRGRMRHMPFVENKPRHTLAYCAYGRKANAKGFEHFYIMKPTDIWTNYVSPSFIYCPGKSESHQHGISKQADKRDYLSRVEMPKQLCDYVAEICTQQIA